jgi:hypothetical protein
MPDEVNWDNVQWGDPVKYNPAEGIPPARPVSYPEAQFLEWLLAYQADQVVSLPAGTSVILGPGSSARIVVKPARGWSAVEGKIAPLVSDKFLKASQFPGLHKPLVLLDPDAELLKMPPGE